LGVSYLAPWTPSAVADRRCRVKEPDDMKYKNPIDFLKGLNQTDHFYTWILNTSCVKLEIDKDVSKIMF